ncbi:MAG: OmpA family protein [Bacteroidota bacterium]
MKKLYIPLLVFIGLNFNVLAQEKSRNELKGDKYAFRYSYNEAIESYNNAKELTLDGKRKLAESYRKIGKNVEAEIVYSEIVHASAGVLPEDHFNFAMTLKTNGKYEEAHNSLDKFAALKPEDLRAKDYVAHKAEFTGFSTDDGKYKTEHLNLNTDAQDFGTSYYIGNKVVFASSRGVSRRKQNGNGKSFLNMYVSAVEDGQLKDPEIFGKSFNSKMNDGPASFSNDGTFMAFTRNNIRDKSKDKIVELAIYFSTYKDEKWSKPEACNLNDAGNSVGHPSLTADGKTMYFTSNAPGGFGGADLYKSTKDEKGEWTKPENLGNQINTEGDEMFPFLEEKTGTFFFASNGRFGLGGLDIFICKTKGAGFDAVYNAGSPLNTQYDDFSPIADGKTDKGYFSSNRVGGSGDDDIYSVSFLNGLETRKKIEGFAKSNDGSNIPQTFITLLDEKGNVLDTLTTKDDAAYTFFIDNDKNFKLAGKKETYTDGEATGNTFGKDRIVKTDVTLLKKEEVAAIKKEEITKKIQVGADLGKILELNNIYYDLDKSDLRPEAVTELTKIVKIMNENPTMVIELSAYTDCRATKEYNQILSDKRAKVPTGYIQSRITNPERIQGKGYGETKLLNSCACEGAVVSICTEADFQKDRRTEFIITKK